MLIQIDGTFLFVIISFIIFFMIIKTVLFAPISKVIEEREKFLTDNFQKENEFKNKAKDLIDKKNIAIKETRSKATNILREISEITTSENEAKVNRIIKNAYARVEDNQQDLDERKNESKREIKSEITEIVETIVSKVLGSETKISLEEEQINQHLGI